LDDAGRIRRPRRYHYLHAAYADALCEAGGLPLYLPIQTPADAPLDAVDGLLVPGGDDLLPPRPYPRGVRFTPVPERQLAFDRALLRAALARGVPLLGVCYGMQLLALEHGADLLYDIASDRPEANAHQLDEQTGRHPVTPEPGTHLAKLLGDAPVDVNSLHHQGVAEAGSGLRVAARAPDGLIEALERPEGPLCLGVQWHPEQLAAPHRVALFGALVAAARSRA